MRVAVTSILHVLVRARFSPAEWRRSAIALLVVAAVSFPLSAAAAAQEEQNAVVTKNQGEQAGAARQAFDQEFTAWKLLLRDLRDLQQQFLIAHDQETDGIRDRYLAKVQEAQAALGNLTDSALAAYAEAPDQDGQLLGLLLSIATDDVARDRYENAAKITQTLVENETKAAGVYDLAGMAAFALQDFEKAEQYWDKARANGIISKGEEFGPALEELKKTWPREQEIRAQEATVNDLPRVRLQTSKGDIVLELFENEAPQTVGNFISLVEKGFYNGLVFHRVLPNFMAQTGCPRGDGSGGPGYNIYCECFQENHRNHFRGSVSMAKQAAPNTGGSQFFMTFLPTPHLNGQHTVFGRVIEGMDVLVSIERRDPDKSDQRAITPDRIIKAEVLRKRDHPYQPTPVAPE